MAIPTISVALATYNGSIFLREQLESICAQSVPPLEVVVTDDCSTDNTLQIAREFSDRLSIRIETNARRLGFLRNFEKAISLCSGEFVSLADQDDVWLPNKLERLVEGINTCAVAHSDARIIDSVGTVVSESLTESYGKSRDVDFMDALFGINNLTGCTLMFRRSALPDLLPFPDDIAFHDAWIGLLSAKRGGIAYVSEPLVHYRIHGQNVIGLRRGTPVGVSTVPDTFTYYSRLASEKVRLRLTETEMRFVLAMRDYHGNKTRRFVAPGNLLTAIRYYRYIYGTRGPRVYYLLRSMFGRPGTYTALSAKVKPGVE